MTDIILSSFLSLFALFGKEEQVDEQRAKAMLISYLRHHLGIRNVEAYLDFYSDMRGAYEMTPDLDTEQTVASICSTLHGNIRSTEESLLLLRLMEFSPNGELCENTDKGKQIHHMFHILAEKLCIPEEQLNNFSDFVNGQPTKHVMLHHITGFEGEMNSNLHIGTKNVPQPYPLFSSRKTPHPLRQKLYHNPARSRPASSCI